MNPFTLAVPIEVETSEHGDYAIVEVRGEVDVYTASTLRKTLSALHERRCRNLIIDADGIEFIDSSGLGVLVGAFKQSRRSGGHGLFVASPSTRVTAQLKITGLSQVFRVSASVEDAVADLHRCEAQR